MLSVVRADTVVSLGRPSQHHRTCGAARQSVRHREFQRRANLRRALVGAEGRGAEFETKRVDEDLVRGSSLQDLTSHISESCPVSNR